MVKCRLCRTFRNRFFGPELTDCSLMATDMCIPLARRNQLGREHAASILVFLDRLEQRLEIALAEAVVALPLDELEEDRADHGLGENLQQDFSLTPVGHAFAVNEDPMLLHALDRLGMTAHPLEAFLVVGVRRSGHEL